jgi:acyl-CoA dehydrogenase
MTALDTLRFPLSFLQSRLPNISNGGVLEAEQQWWKTEGVAVGGAIDRAATPRLRMFDKSGTRTDEILYPANTRPFCAEAIEPV